MLSQENAPVKVGILDLLRNTQSSQYVIPAYQRNYTWTANREVKQFIDDLKAVLRGEYTKHFIGIMIYLEKSINPFTNERSIIDGQQRMTTVFLMLYAIKSILEDRGLKDEAEQLEGTFLINIANKAIRFKLKPLVADDEVYQKIVNHELDSLTDEDKKSNIYKNFTYIKSELIELSNRFPLMEQILPAINLMYIVCVPITNDDYPQKIFESINATGAKLTASDLIRNFILMPIESDKQDEYYNKYWKKLEDLISSESKKLEAFFRFFCIAKTTARVNKSGVYESFVKWYKENLSSYGVEAIFQEIVNYATYYNRIYIADINQLPKEMQKPVAEFRYILSDMPAPVLMELYAISNRTDEKGNNLISTAQLGEVITLLNIYLMRRALCGLDTSDISNYFPTFLKDVIESCNGDYTRLIDVVKLNLVNRNKGNSMELPDNKKLRDIISQSNMYNLRLWLNIFFRKLEMHDNPAPIDFSKLNIEHLMPQTPTMDWYGALQTNKEEYERNFNRLGNLTLATRTDNSKMGNKVWEYKNQILASTAHLKMNIEILKKEHWDLQAVEERTNYLIDKITELYPYFEDKTIELERIPINISQDGAKVDALYYPDNGSVEIIEGSILNTKFPTAEKYPEIEEQRQDLIDEGIIEKIDNELMFIKSYIFYPKRAKDTALSTTASIVLHGTRNGWEWWLMENGEPIDKLRRMKVK